MGSRPLRNILISLLAFLSLGAIGGGVVLIISPDGRLIGMPAEMLAHSPFVSFLIPGLVLFVILGICPLLLIYALIRKPASRLAETLNFFGDMHWSWTFCIYLAFALIGWIQIEIAMIRSYSWLQMFYAVYALAIIFNALLPKVRAEYKKHEEV